MRIAFMNFAIFYRICVTNEHWYVWFVLTAGHFICICLWLGTMCDIWPVVGVSSMMNATRGTGPYLPSWAFVSNSSFNGVPVAQTLVSNEDHCFAFVLSLSLSLSLWPLSFGMLVLVTQMLPSVFPYTYWVSNCHCMYVFFICSYLFSNQITSMQPGAFKNLTSLNEL